MHPRNTAALFVGLAAQHALASSGSWIDQTSYSVPENTNNQCSSSQQGGYNWSGLPSGPFSSYGSNSFTGFSCTSSLSKNSTLSRRSFQDKCITGSLDDQPSISCEDGDSMTINQMQVSSTQDTDVECSYGMPDGTTCTEYHSCSSSGSVFQNTQCGGAKSVTFKPGKNAPAGCSIGVHSVDFNCASASSTAPGNSATAYTSHPVTVQSYATTTSSAEWNTDAYASTTASESSATTYTSTPVIVQSYATTTSSPAWSSGLDCYGKDCSSTVVSPSSPISSVTAACYGNDCTSSWSGPGYAPSSSAAAPQCYGDDCSTVSTSATPSSSLSSASWSPAVYPSPTPATYASTSWSISASSSAAGYGSFSAASHSSASYSSWGSSSPNVYPSSHPASYASASSSTAHPNKYPSPNCPGVLPKCLKTWLFKTGCTDASDYNCFCGNQQFIENVMGCISAWSDSESDTQAAASYLMGICADHIPNNPAIVTACPSTVTPAATPAWSYPTTSNTITSPAQTVPCTTITYSSSVIVPAAKSSSSYTTMIITTITVPQVHMTTSTLTAAGTTTCSVGLGAGKPSSVSAWTTPATPSTPVVQTTPTGNSTPVLQTTPISVQTSAAVVCSEYIDGQPQCDSPTAAASAPPAYTPGSLTAVASSPTASAPSAYSAASSSFGTSYTAVPSATYAVPATGAGDRIRMGFVGMIVVAVGVFVVL